MWLTNQKIRRLPGFRFEAQNASRENILPRMDVALFVGFAASGPIGIPVALESAEQFNRIFGRDLPLVWNRERGETIRAFLPPTVRAFFRNGGKRCWVIRTARVQATGKNPLNRAAENFFPLAGLASVHFDNQEISDIAPAFARARSKGSWSDDLQIGTATLSRAVRFHSLEKSGEQKIATLEVSADEPIVIGELLRFNFPDENLVLLMTADKFADDSEKQSTSIMPSVGKLIVRIASERFVWLENLPAVSSPAPSGNVSVKLWTRQKNPSATDFSPAGFLTIHPAELKFQPPKNESGSPKIKLKFKDLPASKSPTVGSLLMTEFQNKPLCLQIETVNVNDLGEQESIEAVCRAVFCPRDVSEPNSTPTAERLAFELWQRGEQSFVKLSDLAFNVDHQRFWGNLPTDENLYRLSDEKSAEFPKIFDWTQTGEAATFPLAGNGDRKAFYFPLFPTALPENYLGAATAPGTKLQRDGLEIFDETLFLDEQIKNTGLNNLLNEAEFIRYLSSRPRPLWGIHSALAPETIVKPAPEGQPTEPRYASLSLEEATIIAVPDALHLGWAQQKNDETILLPPISAAPLRPEWWTFQDCRKPDVKSVSQPLWGNFLDCGIRVLEIPFDLEIKEEKVSAGKFTLQWKYAEENESLKFVLEESATPNFNFAQEIYRGKKKELAIDERSAGFYFYRVRAEIGSEFSDWSIGLAIEIPAAENWVANHAAEYEPDVLLAVQTALLRMCAARGDLFAVLDLPEHYEKEAAINHAATLKMTKGFAAPNAGVEPFSQDEARTALSFGAIYHPWLMTLEDNFETVRNIPPGGATCGVFARRAAQRGAWIAPANEVLQGVLGLAKTFPRASFLDFQDGLINLVRHEPTGLMVLDSDTLSDEFDLRSINVRRLLSLLRRLALKHGAEYVFEPHDERFRRQVQRGFSSLLNFMFARGAFAGTTPAKSYQVSVGEFLNNPQSVEQGRFIVELRVAPSLPLKFVNVRLIQADGRGSVTEVF